MGLLSKFKKTNLFGASLGILGSALRRPGTEGLSSAERQALEQNKIAEDERRKRLSEGMRRRARVALGIQGGERSLLFGGYSGVQQASAPVAPLGGSTPTGAA